MSEPECLKLHVLDVGHGDSLIIEFPDGVAHAIVDCNWHKETNRGFGVPHSAAEPKALTYFKKLFAQKREPVVEFACLTHPHYDHYHGLTALLEGLIELKVPVRAYWDFGASVKKAEAMARMARKAEQKERLAEFERLCRVQTLLTEKMNASYEIVFSKPGQVFWSGHGVTVEALAPHPKHYSNYLNFLACRTDEEQRLFIKYSEYSVNDNIVCPGFLLKYGDFRLLLGSDLTNEAWQMILEPKDNRGKMDPTAHAVKVSHHGSFEGNFPDGENPLWPAIRAQASDPKAIISGGYRAGLPHAKVIRSLQTCGWKAFCTGRGRGGLKPYRPPGISDEDYSALNTPIMQVAEVVDSSDSGNGNVTVHCFPDGHCTITTEFEFDVFLQLSRSDT